MTTYPTGMASAMGELAKPTRAQRASVMEARMSMGNGNSCYKKCLKLCEGIGVRELKRIERLKS
jgi:hypothetical protein